MKNKNIRNTKYEIRNTFHEGTALLMTVLILNSILLISLATAQLVISGVRNNGTQVRSTQAYFAAEAGAERVLYEYRKGVNTCGQAGYATTTCVYSGNIVLPAGGNSSYAVSWAKGDNNPGDTLTFISVGTYAGLGRSDQLDFSY